MIISFDHHVLSLPDQARHARGIVVFNDASVIHQAVYLLYELGGIHPLTEISVEDARFSGLAGSQVLLVRCEVLLHAFVTIVSPVQSPVGLFQDFSDQTLFFHSACCVFFAVAPEESHAVGVGDAVLKHVYLYEVL